MAVPELETFADWFTMTIPPRLPLTDALAIWFTPVLDEFPVASASPVLTLALPSELLLAVPVLLATELPLPPPPPAACELFAVLDEALPVAVFPPVVAVAEPSFVTFASWSMITMAPRQPLAASQTLMSAVWFTFVVEELPVAEALPVLMPALPLELLDVEPVLLATPEVPAPPPDPAAWSLLASLSDALPVAVLPPVLASAEPELVTVEF
ncbi:MAG TPA: hypothetical protein VNT56_01630 [Acidimicrobiales bacterium]|nr:hypothetical protein [Acidimicrobiales bacterium]